jgi:hypothetical protein
MSIDTNTTSPAAITESAVNQAAEAIIQTNCNRHGMSREQFPADGVEEARRIARQELEADAALKANPLFLQLEAERAARLQAEATLAAVSQSRANPNAQSVRTGPDPNVVRAQLGEVQWKMLSDNGRLQACGIQPSSVTPVELLEAKKLFGRGMVSSYSSNFFKQDQARYQHLKRIAVVLNIQGQ